ncbi:MAG: hypothetical protein Q4B03_01305, partial [Lachnospiraceae bacterium]|nr:hypothetical protein [Lachnospiraceae bacterium]
VSPLLPVSCFHASCTAIAPTRITVATTVIITFIISAFSFACAVLFVDIIIAHEMDNNYKIQA